MGPLNMLNNAVSVRLSNHLQVDFPMCYLARGKAPCILLCISLFIPLSVWIQFHLLILFLLLFSLGWHSI